MERTQQAGIALTAGIPPASGRALPAVSATTLACLLALPAPARALGIGELELHSALGQPLHAQVALDVTPDEAVDSACLSLIAPQPGESDEYLTQARLTLLNENGVQKVIIRGLQPLHSPFIRIQLQVKCPGQGSVSRSFVALPDLILERNTADAVVLPAVPPPASRWTEAAPPAPTETPAAAPAQPARPPRPPETEKPAATAPQKPNPAPVAAPATDSGFRLKLSSGSIDTSRIGKVSKDERAKLLTQQKLLDAADDHASDVLALQQQVKELQSELNEIRLKLKMSQQPLAVPPASQPAPFKPAAPQSLPELGLSTYLALGLSILLAALLGLRAYQRKLKQRWTGEDIWQSSGDILGKPAAPDVQPPAKPVTPQPAATIVETPVAAETPTQASAEQQPPAEAAVAQRAMTPEEQNAAAELDSMVEEAELYAVHGHPDLAIKILTKLVEQSPEKSEAWLLLLSIYSSLDRRSEFEEAARRFATFDKDGVFWKEVQMLGHRIDQDNPLYFGQAPATSPAQSPLAPPKTHRRPIGGILLDIGALSEEALMDALAVFHPKRDGRFGGFLLGRGLITEAQLEQALEIQHQDSLNAPPGP